MSLRHIHSLGDIASSYRAILCDVWGVLHNGVDAYRESAAALVEARKAGLVVVLITNSPRPRAGVEDQLATIGIDSDAWDAIVTSGDVTRDLIALGARKVFHIGPDRDHPIFDGLDVELVEEHDATTVVCTGLFDDETEEPAAYEALLRRLRSRDLPFVCANPDITVERGERLIWCAGALARDYGLIGGRTLIAGKPFRPIYERAIAVAGEHAGGAIEHRDILAIGDGMLTDVKGADDFGLDVLYVSGGVHARDYGDALSPDPERLAAFMAGHGRVPVAVIARLR